jgi:Predicted acyltransferases
MKFRAETSPCASFLIRKLLPKKAVPNPMHHKHPHLAHPKYRADIDGLRAVAILSVISFHAFPDIMPGGFIGVDIFFVISGFLISTIIFSSLERDRFSLLEFYIRRIKRIVPAFNPWCCSRV